jgi:hypothetical protein
VAIEPITGPMYCADSATEVKRDRLRTGTQQQMTATELGRSGACAVPGNRRSSMLQKPLAMGLRKPKRWIGQPAGRTRRYGTGC